MNETMDNQQETSHRLAWLSGIWDGEGTFGIYHCSYRKNGTPYYVGRLTLTNTSVAMINEIVKILDYHDIKGHLWQETPRKKQHTPCTHITINALNKVKQCCELMLPYLVNKKPNAELLIRFVNSRLTYKRKVEQDKKTGRLLGVIKQGYSEQEKSFYDQMTELNASKGSSSTIR